MCQVTLNEISSHDRQPAPVSVAEERNVSQTGVPIAIVGMACRFPVRRTWTPSGSFWSRAGTQ